jgi:hypothetical protein
MCYEAMAKGGHRFQNHKWNRYSIGSAFKKDDIFHSTGRQSYD